MDQSTAIGIHAQQGVFYLARTWGYSGVCIRFLTSWYHRTRLPRGTVSAATPNRGPTTCGHLGCSVTAQQSTAQSRLNNRLCAQHSLLTLFTIPGWILAAGLQGSTGRGDVFRGHLAATMTARVCAAAMMSGVLVAGSIWGAVRCTGSNSGSCG